MAFSSSVLCSRSIKADDDTVTSTDGTTDGLYVVGTAINFCLVLTVTLKVALMMRTWTVLNYIFIAFSLGVWFCFIVLNDAVISPTFRGVATHLFTTPAFWLCGLLVPFLARPNQTASWSLLASAALNAIG